MLNAPPTTSGLFARLREATAAQHQRLESSFHPGQFDDRVKYLSLIERLWGFYEPTEKNLARLDWSSTGIDFERRLKTPWLEADLRSLGSKGSLPRAAEVPHPANLDEAIGCLYVLEGATLGGQIISKHLRALGITSGNGGAFYNSYGDQIGDQWLQFKQAAVAYCAEEAQICSAASAAVQTFGQFESWFTTP